jgi:gamma-glutamylaminecyclotransferase
MCCTSTALPGTLVADLGPRGTPEVSHRQTNPMPRLFVYGSLKRGFANEHVNTGTRVAGQYRTRDRYLLVLLGDGEVPCLVSPPGAGHQVVGELYDVNADDIARIDRLERVGEPQGYERVEIVVERYDLPSTEQEPALVYVKQEHAILSSTPRIGPLPEYRQEHAARFRWTGAA